MGRAMYKHCSVLLPILLTACHPATPTAPAIDVHDAWARETAPGQTGAAAYRTVVISGNEADLLVGVSSPRATGAMLHGSNDSGGVMAMRMIDAVPIAGGATVTLAPLGTHVMLTGLSAPLKVGERIPLTLRFARVGERQVDAAVLAAGSNGPAR